MENIHAHFARRKCSSEVWITGKKRSRAQKSPCGDWGRLLGKQRSLSCDGKIQPPAGWELMPAWQ
ncbi:hypothetical protein KI387_041613, partial [Taxus chinensis]